MEPMRLPRLRRRATWLAAHRVEMSVYYRRMEPEEYRTLSALRRGLTLGAALEAGFEGSKLAEGRRPKKVREWFATWAELGWLCRASSEEQPQRTGREDD